MADVVDRYEAMDVLCFGAEAAAELAEIWRSRGEARRATAAQQRSAELAQRAGGIRTPALARGRSVEPLTAREREVALLAQAVSAAVRSAIACICRRVRSTPTWPACTASWASADVKSSLPPSDWATIRSAGRVLATPA